MLSNRAKKQNLLVMILAYGCQKFLQRKLQLMQF